LVDKDFNAKGQDSGPVQKKIDSKNEQETKNQAAESKDTKLTKK